MPGDSGQSVKCARGLLLMELLLAMLMSALLLAGLVQIAAGARNSFRLQEAMAEVQENGRFAIDTLGGILRRSDFTPEPWSEGGSAIGFTAQTGDGVNRHGDRVAVRTWSERNCFDNANPVDDNNGLPRFFLKEDVLEVSANGDLVRTCRYGPGEDRLTTQLLRQGLVQHVDALQLLYAEDLDSNGAADSWVPGGHWQSEKRITGLQLDILLSSANGDFGLLVERRTGE